MSEHFTVGQFSAHLLHICQQALMQAALLAGKYQLAAREAPWLPGFYEGLLQHFEVEQMRRIKLRRGEDVSEQPLELAVYSESQAHFLSANVIGIAGSFQKQIRTAKTQAERLEYSGAEKFFRQISETVLEQASARAGMAAKAGVN